jgi:hypothetical protein
MYKQITFAIAAALLLTAFVTVASGVFNPAHAQNATGGMAKNATGAAGNMTSGAGNMTSGAGANMTKK